MRPRESSRFRPRPRLTILGRSFSTFHVCGMTGLLVGTAVALTLADRAGLSQAVVVVLLCSGLLTFLALAMVTKIVTGRESLVYYHHEIAILTVAAALLASLQLPVLAYLDVTALGIGVFLAFGRCGCLMVGCCQGKPHKWGIRYGLEHSREGFPDWYVGARLFPVQALEALIVALIVIAGAASIIDRNPAGTAWSLYVVAYSTARIWLEELRGDGVRPYWLRLSEAQWTSLALIAAVVFAEWQGRVPWTAWHAAAFAISAASMLWLAVRRTGVNAILNARHAGEIAAIVNRSPAGMSSIEVRRTSHAIGVSTQPLPAMGGADATLYSLSRAGDRLTTPEAASLARLIVDVAAPADAEHEIVRGGHDVFHLIVRRRGQMVSPHSSSAER
jgi:hypothetical protein